MMWRPFVAVLLAALGALAIQAQSQEETPSQRRAPVDDNRVLHFLTFNQLEGRTSGPDTAFRWDAQGWIGTDYNKLWFKSEGKVTGGTMSDGDHEILYDRPIPRLRYLDWQVGVRTDLDSGPARVWAAIGMEGLAPYTFDIEPTLYFRDGGNVAGRLSGSYNLRITQRLILQPQIELNFYSQRDPARGIGAGLSNLDSGMRLGYQISRKFAPYIGFTYSENYGETARFARQAGTVLSCSRCFVFGIWAWK
jgi:copper resistance protein B